MSQEGNTCFFIIPMIKGLGNKKFFWKFILGHTQRSFSMKIELNCEEISSHYYAEGACDLIIICCTRKWYSWRTFFFHGVFTNMNKWKRCLVYINYHFGWDLMSYDDFIDIVVKCVSNFRYQTCCRFMFSKAYLFCYRFTPFVSEFNCPSTFF